MFTAAKRVPDNAPRTRVLRTTPVAGDATGTTPNAAGVRHHDKTDIP